MAFSSDTTVHGEGTAAGNFVTTLAKVGRKALSGAHAFLRSMQTARMMASLSEMSDQQLAQIGISRSDIPKYARRLMAES